MTAFPAFIALACVDQGLALFISAEEAAMTTARKDVMREAVIKENNSIGVYIETLSDTVFIAYSSDVNQNSKET